ncbi:MAG: LysM domain-containing protein [Desulfobacterales bacterium]
MVDASKENHEDFVISEDNDTAGDEDFGQQDYYGDQTGLLQNKSNLVYIIGGIGLVVIVILLVMVLSGPSDSVDREKLQAQEERIQALEQKLATVSVISQALDRIENNEKDINLFMERVDRFEGTVTTQIDQIIKELGALHRKTGAGPAPKPKATPPVAKSPVQKKVNVHEVKAGDTLYSISRHYGLTVDQLRTFNNIGKDAAIRPGQKLKLSPP